MKVAVLGSGAAGCIFSMLACRNLPMGFTVTCIHDPEIPTIEVGETASPGVLDILYDCLNFSVAEDLTQLDGTLRTSVKHFWAKANKDFYITYDRRFGLHLNSTKFSNFVLSRLHKLYPNKFLEDKTTVLNVDSSTGLVETKNGQQYYDLVVDCRGFADKKLYETGEIVRPNFTAVNSVIIWPEKKSYNEYYTTAEIHDNGWMFGVPLTTRKAWGYLFNNKITSLEEAKKDFQKIKNLDDETINSCRTFSWDQYYRVKAMDNKVLYLGNNLYFFEPSGAIPLHYYLVISKIITEDFGRVPFNDHYISEINKYHLSMIHQHLDITALSYAGKNNLNTKFWNTAKSNAINSLKNSTDWKKWINLDRTTNQYFTHPAGLMDQYISGFEIDIKQFM